MNACPPNLLVLTTYCCLTYAATWRTAEGSLIPWLCLYTQVVQRKYAEDQIWSSNWVIPQELKKYLRTCCMSHSGLGIETIQMRGCFDLGKWFVFVFWANQTTSAGRLSSNAKSSNCSLLNTHLLSAYQCQAWASFRRALEMGHTWTFREGDVESESTCICVLVGRMSLSLQLSRNWNTWLSPTLVAQKKK